MLHGKIALERGLDAALHHRTCCIHAERRRPAFNGIGHIGTEKDILRQMDFTQ